MKIEVSPRAAQEISDTTAYYSAIHPYLAERLLEEYYSIIEHISGYPLMYRKITKIHRIASLHTFPYEIYYQVRKTAVQIIAFIPGRIHPKTKVRRLKGKS